jgi:hypothetical protein
MQRVAILKKLADEKIPLTQKIIRDACIIFRHSNKKYEKILVSKALWGLSAGWDNSFGNNGIECAQLLIKAGANPKEQLTIEEVLQVKNENGTVHSWIGESYETTPFDTAQGDLKNFFESLRLTS